MRILLAIALSFFIISFTNGCDTPTYPKGTLQKSIMELCREEYNLDIDAKVVGNTLAIYLPLRNLFDLTLNLSENAQDKIQDVLLVASRVVLSTDADIRFYCMITQDVRIPEIQLVIIKYVDDVKRAFHQDISRNQYYRRTLIDINENPQAAKEKAIKDVFSKMNLEKEWQEKVLDDFFRSPPSSLEGIGYWSGEFYVKNITLEEFLAQQIASRIRLRFRERKPLLKYALRSVTGKFVAENSVRFFFITLRTESLLFVNDPEERISYEREIFGNIFEEISDVICAYKYRNFDFARVLEEATAEKLLVSKEDIYLFKAKKLPLDIIVGALR